ncbi:unnamed protein product [Strongylus vulgaris]|uniref:Uncharacterized protein n=1 Tax=Strongylus vulgaris TaxID=40348 RepID=A0A3P7L436_STRVU|nr:unnamed protein product [Strongylus vulgaris]
MAIIEIKLQAPLRTPYYFHFTFFTTTNSSLPSGDLPQRSAITSPGYPLTPSSASKNHCYHQLPFSNTAADDSKVDAFYEDLEEVIHKENSFYKFAWVTLMRKSECQKKRSTGSGFGSGLRNENGNRLVELLSVARLFHGNSIFMEKEHRRWTWESVKDHRLLRAKMRHRVGGRREVLYDSVRLEELLTICDWPIEENPTNNYDLLLSGLWACGESTLIPRTRKLRQTPKATKDLLKRKRALRLDPTASHLQRLATKISQQHYKKIFESGNQNSWKQHKEGEV